MHDHELIELAAEEFHKRCRKDGYEGDIPNRRMSFVEETDDGTVMIILSNVNGEMARFEVADRDSEKPKLTYRKPKRD